MASHPIQPQRGCAPPTHLPAPTKNNNAEFGYNSRDELESGAKHQSDGNLLAGRQFSYEYDDVGNRKTASFGDDEDGDNLRTIGYTTHQLNQYTAITHPGIAQVLGYSPDDGHIPATPGQQGETAIGGISGVLVRIPTIHIPALVFG